MSAATPFPDLNKAYGNFADFLARQAARGATPYPDSLQVSMIAEGGAIAWILFDDGTQGGSCFAAPSEAGFDIVHDGFRAVCARAMSAARLERETVH